ncbi:16S rRNA (cytosine(967)-C(5))-methyltransferase RsmB [Streptococcus cuniculipharyngis]|uniref:16S rRNA (cytosine(967)-C(5))-methyltransferase n=1 Tax=Streptococcus cuniculipharyngis TaxID=1562651 RepID=A0A5C5SE77_9STRE|nr:16S rRNA (cytosine(967)-C(5))-methyltransferase RsmB [Streptococcus cuniculipharyngis]TWS98101.1 16S rRNA (cytosine(967)-C(5))-methyltransferase RsmB [Streptococcus cuniculipharyngis]
MANKWQETARGQALLTLAEIFHEGAYTNIALHKRLSGSQLSRADKSLLTELVYGTVTRKLTLEWYLSHYVADRDRLDSWVYDLLLMSAYQLLYLDKIPQHAVVNEAVQLAKQRQSKGADKLINAILRQLSQQDLPDPQTIKRLNKRYAIMYSLPVWLVRKMIEQFGQERAVQMFASLLERNKASVRVTQPEKLAELKDELAASPSLLSSVGLVKDSGHFAGTRAFKAGEITIQDESSQLVAPTLGLEGHEIVLDACAAPGGKTSHLASYLTTGQVLALDLYDHKLALIEENAKRLGLTDRIKTQRLDASQVHKQFPAETFDKILVDAPCSGLGLLRRKPDIKYQKKEADLQELQTIQLKILDSVCQTLKKGGIITYSTCTIFSEENQDLIQRFLETHPNFEQVNLEHDQKDIMVDGCLVITPEQYQTDGFFIGQVRRIS